ncbi:MAG: Gfo/Idh/MocA family oxidoreductase, partial [Theionarchaea archaeon]|nr:Gfo/Idh/MocA family oxidoreductase [Theionarchaea archaeon]
SYASAFKRIRECKLVGVADPDSRRGREMATANSTKLMSVEELLADESISAVCIGSANARHREDVEIAAEAGKNIMVEKPIATRVEDAESMIAKCKKEGVFLQVAFVMRYSPIALEAKAAIDGGSVGEIQAISGTNHGSMPGGWFIDKDLSGGGAILDHTVHIADLMNWYLGSRAKRVFALGGNRLYPGLGIDDSGFVLVQYDGAVGSIDPSWSRPEGHPIWGDVRMRIFGSEGTLEIDGFNQNIGLTRSGERLNLVGYGSDVDLYTCRDLIESSIEGREPRSTGKDGLAALEIALGAYESIRTGGTVDLPFT